jgi:D-alanyl-D-alanine carboxypeptidase (penicillin-binding protein 5/6)
MIKKGKADILFKKFIVMLAVCMMLFNINANADNVSAKGAALIEQTSGRLLYGKNENVQLPMASTTKMMTGLLAVESGKLDNIYTVPPEGLRVEGSSMGLLPDEKITLRDLTYGLMLESGNDAANTIAILLGGSISGFVDMMNKKAQSIGLINTHFQTPSGLDADGHYTTAFDLARLGAYAMKNKDFVQIVSTSKIKITYNGIKNARTLYNHNKLLGDCDGTIGIKTGFTKKCGRCLVSCAIRDGVCLVVCTLNDPNDWSDHKNLLDLGFSKLKSQNLLSTALNLNVNVVGGVSDHVAVKYDANVTAALQDGEISDVKMQIQLPRFAYAPIKKNQDLGKIVFTLNNYVVATTNLTADQSVSIPINQHKSYFGGIWDTIISFLQNIF